LILAAAGLLEGSPATTPWGAAGMLNIYGAHYQPKRWVEDGRFIMAAGVSAGIDMALYLVARLTNQATMRRVQLDIEYDPQPPVGRVDFARLDRVPRAIRRVVTLAAPLLTRRSKQLSKQAGWS
jgi:transcriptional regulator GlxA family with amidase domain